MAGLTMAGFESGFINGQWLAGLTGWQELVRKDLPILPVKGPTDRGRMRKQARLKRRGNISQLRKVPREGFCQHSTLVRLSDPTESSSLALT